MAEFDMPYTTFYQFAIVSIALSCTIFESFDAQQCRALERPLKVIDRSHTSS